MNLFKWFDIWGHIIPIDPSDEIWNVTGFYDGWYKDYEGRLRCHSVH